MNPLYVVTDIFAVTRAGKNIVSGADEAITNYKNKFRDLLEAFRTLATLHIEITTLAISRNISDLGETKSCSNALP
jgi:hypothetical protein